VEQVLEVLKNKFALFKNCFSETAILHKELLIIAAALYNMDREVELIASRASVTIIPILN
jgi:hypothetical protein